jgi:hypothetical protein
MAETPEELIARLQKENEALKGNADNWDKLTSSYNKTQRAFDINVNTFSKYSETLTLNLTNITESIDTLTQSMSFEGALSYLDLEATKIQNAFGTSKERLQEFKESIADLAPELVQFGLDQDDAAKMVIGLGEALGTTGIVGQEALVEIAASAQVSAQEFATLATNFRNVGVSIYDVGDRMEDIIDYAKKVGVSVKAVSDGVITNLDKMNIYNFENGINGLTKMAAQAARLGVDMGTVFGLAEKIFNPEGAIELAAGLQRLGVVSSDLLDPLRAMDLAANDPEELQNQLIDLTKTFTRFNEQTQQFEIMPGEKRRLREIAQEMNIPIGQLTQMSIKAADFDRKLKQIEFPDFAGDKETREMIAGMSQIKGGRAIIEIKDQKTGIKIDKDVKDLTKEDIDKLKESDAESAKTAEQLAIEQLDQLKLLNTQIAAAAGKTVLGLATNEQLGRAQQAGQALTRSLAMSANEQFGTRDVRRGFEQITSPFEEGVAGAIKTGDVTKIQQGLSDSFNKLIELESKIETNSKEIIQKAYDYATTYITETYKGVGESKIVEKKEQEINLNFKISSDQNTSNIDGRAITESVIASLKGSLDLANTFKSTLNINPLSE